MADQPSGKQVAAIIQSRLNRLKMVTVFCSGKKRIARWAHLRKFSKSIRGHFRQDLAWSTCRLHKPSKCSQMRRATQKAFRLRSFLSPSSMISCRRSQNRPSHHQKTLNRENLDFERSKKANSNKAGSPVWRTASNAWGLCLISLRDVRRAFGSRVAHLLA